MRYALLILVALLISTTGPAVGQVQVTINLGSQPVWGPIGYDYVEYYYFPDTEVYYYVPGHRYYYYGGGRWISATRLPGSYAHFDVYNSYKVVVNEKEPWRNHKSYRAKYISYKGRRGQTIIRDSRDPKYFIVKGHPEHGKAIKQQRMQKSGRGPDAVRGNKSSRGNEMLKGNRDENSRSRKPDQRQKNTRSRKGNEGKK